MKVIGPTRLGYLWDNIKSYIASLLDDKQDVLESGTNIKTINNESILGSGNITIQGGGSGDANVIEGVKVNGTSLTPDSNKDVDIPQASASEFGVVRMSTDSVVNNQSELNDAGLTGIYGNALFVKAATTTQGGAITPAMVTKLNGLNAVTESTVSGWGFTKNTGTYSKPNGGIPKSDLENDVQTSLGKADTALQSFTESDPTVPAWAKAANKPSYTASEVGALPDTYVAPVTSVNGQTGAVSLTIPAAVTESTVSGWGFTKNTGNVGSTTVSSIVTLTEAQYEALSTKDSSTLYIITSS